MKKYILIATLFVLGILTSSVPLRAQPTPTGTPLERVTLADLLANKDRLTNKLVAVEGVLVNRGTNYFTDLRLVLMDPLGPPGTEVLVRPWLPTELPPRQSGADSSRPTMTEYIGKKVLIQGVLTDDVVKNVGKTKVLRVESARVIG